ncbi:hypothetical protein D9615_010262 [Tricholomella constricta]|uniref:Uncharacterized protein n=1 Tax=Tricholomella constricta TaxID=117010 RepID=A0A8H5LU97_9AGAR|nr:hypothetical protein D9615_010262 [Tricholomella constricta]
MENPYAFLSRELNLFKRYNPPHRSPDPGHLCPKLTPPITFYHKHLEERLMLRNVEHMSLEICFAQLVDKTLRSIKERGDLPPPPNMRADLFPSQAFRASCESKRLLTDAKDVARLYQKTTALYCRVLTSTLLLHLRAPGWLSSLAWRSSGSAVQEHVAFVDAYSVEALDVDSKVEIQEELLNAMGEQTKSDLRQLKRRRYPALAYWAIFFISQEAENLLKDLDRIVSSAGFDHQQCRTAGYRAPPTFSAYILDATTTPWGVPTSSMPLPATSTSHHQQIWEIATARYNALIWTIIVVMP